jgi:SAM-dependent methyltransferase
MSSLCPHCPDCGGNVDTIGPIPVTDVFAGRILEHTMGGGRLYRCRHCLLGFRWPRLPIDQLEALYSEGDDHTWTAPAHTRRDWGIAQRWFGECLRPGSTVLDVGCFDGGFLEPMIGSYRCFGTEIQQQARNRAEAKGITLVGIDFAESSRVFDCVTAFDVIEHVENPARFLAQCLDVIHPGGYVLIATGNLDSLSFRLMGSRYWYCTIAEHISFVSPAWLARIVSVLGCRVEKMATFAHGRTSLYCRTKGLVINLLYRASPAFFRYLRKRGLGGKNVKLHPNLADHPPEWVSARDHFIVLMRKI